MIKRYAAISFLIIISGIFIIESIADTLMSEKMANSVMSYHYGKYLDGTKTWSYVTGTVLKGLQEVYLNTNNAEYLSYIKNTVNAEVDTDGTMESYSVTDYNLDQVREGAAVLFLYEKTGAAKYRKAVDTIRTQLNVGQHPRTSEGGFWHKKTYPYQMWLDGLYMAEPFYAQYTKAFDSLDTAALNDIVNQFTLMENHARDSVTGLIYHGWDEKKVQSWADTKTGCSKSFWGRSMGWYAMGLVDVLDYIPSPYSKRNNLIAILNRLLTALVTYQDSASGCWYQVVDKGDSTGNYLESSATCMYVYSILKAVRLGYVDDSLLAAGCKGYEGILSTFIADSSGILTISNVCSSAGLSDTRNGTFSYYISESVVSNDGKAQGAFMLASLEYEKIQSTHITGRTRFSNKEAINLRKSGNILSLESDVNVKIDFYNLCGRHFRIPCAHVNNLGRYMYSMNMSGFPSGTYIVKIKAGKFSGSRKIVWNRYM